MMLKNILFIGLGGAFGSILRYLIGFYILKYFPTISNLGTLIVNILACFLVGIFVGISLQNNQILYKLLLITGFCGGFSTFSAFAFENIQFINKGEYLMAMVYIGLSLFFGFMAVGAGLMFSKVFN